MPETKRLNDYDNSLRVGGEACPLCHQLHTSSACPTPNPLPDAKRDEGPSAYRFGWFPRNKYRDLVFYVEADQGMNRQLFEMPDTPEARVLMSQLAAPASQSQNARKANITQIRLWIEQVPTVYEEGAKGRLIYLRDKQHVLAALARLSAPAEKTVPMAMIEEFGRYMIGGQDRVREIFAHYGYKVED